MNKLLATTLCTSILISPLMVQADNDFDNLSTLQQSKFHDLSETLGAASSYKSVSPSEPLGITGFDIAIELSATELDKDLFEEASGSSWKLDYLPMPKIHLHKGLPFGLDVGAFLSGAPGTDIRLMGAELRYAFVSGNMLLPAVAVRMTYSLLDGVDELDLSNKGIELTVSKGFTILTPYAGIGKIRTESEAVDVAELDKETINSTKMFAGLNINLGFNLGLEVDVTGGIKTYSVKTGFRF